MRRVSVANRPEHRCVGLYIQPLDIALDGECLAFTRDSRFASSASLDAGSTQPLRSVKHPFDAFNAPRAAFGAISLTPLSIQASYLFPRQIR